MRKIINNLVIAFSFILIGIITIFGFLPKITLSVFIMMGGFIIPILVILITMIIQIKEEKDLQAKDKIRTFWLKILFIIYCFLLINILFLNNQYRINGFTVKIFSSEHFETINIIPFSTIIGFISKLIKHNINKNIVIINIISNLLLFAPMGFFIPLLFKEKIKNIKQFVGLIFIVTLIVEILQFITYRGSTDIDDIILNTLGAVIVYCLMKTKFVKNLLKNIFDITE